jgi:2-polyprenyl-3-methyl-5-hydroxy-6-metoxy-1,4-benzoquinol methylase
VSESLFGRFRRRWLGTDPAPAAAAAPVSVPPLAPPVPSPSADAEVEVIEMAEVLSGAFPQEYPFAATAAEQVLMTIQGADLSRLARHSPALLGYDWTGYLTCSTARVVRAHHAVATYTSAGARVLDFGSYFGNFSLALRAAGYRVEAIDSYDAYGSALAGCVAMMRERGIAVHDFGPDGVTLEALAGRYDAVICAGVVEHIPHTPRHLLDRLTTLLAPGGVLVMDTPNLAYLYHRLALLEGRSIFAPLPGQYYTELPFEGHHREYTVSEVEWMLKAAGHDVLSIETFNYSVFAQPRLSGEALAYHRAMLADPSLRELIISVSRQASR